MANTLIKSEQDIKLIKAASAIWKKARNAVIEASKVGVSLLELDAIANNIINENKAIAAFHRYMDFPGHICISVNDCIIHGVPTEYRLKDGDMVSFDIGVKFEEHICDAAFTVIIGQNVDAQNISDVCKNSLYEAIKILRPGTTTNQIAMTIQDYVESHGYQVIRDFTGHGCGNKLHEDPVVSNYRSNFFPNFKLEENMVICIEPMILTGSHKYTIDTKDGWSVRSKNKKLTCHWEHMLLITNDGCEILTE